MVTAEMIEALDTRSLKQTDAAQGLPLSRAAGWNQTGQDWEMMIEHGWGIGMFTPENRVVATAMLLPFGETLCWISMVLVDEAWRRQGLATDLMNACLEKADERGLIVGLDATEYGEKVYQQLGFEGFARFTRLKLDPDALPVRPLVPELEDSITIESLQPEDFPRILRWDKNVFGGDRSYILEHQYSIWPEAAFVALDSEGEIQGYTLGRKGSKAREFGPIMAYTEAVADHLYVASVRLKTAPVYMDVGEHFPRFKDHRLAEGWKIERGFVRMIRGDLDGSRQIAHIYASAGPDFG